MTGAGPPRRAWGKQIMGLPVSVHLRGPDVDRPAVRDAVARVFADLRRADAVFSTYRAGSDLSRWERGELPLAGADTPLAAVYATAAAAWGPWAMDWLEGLAGYEGLMVTASGLVRVTAGWPTR